MVNRLVKYVLWGCLALAAALAAAVYWLLWTTSGAEWALGAASRWTPLEIAAGRVDGVLAKRLRLEQLEVDWPQGGASAAQLELDWHLAALLRGHLEVEQLRGAKIEVRLPPPAEEPPEPREKAPFAFSWPRLSGLPLRLQADIRRLDVTELILRPATGEPLVIERAAVALGWHEGILSVTGLEIASSLGSAQAQLRAGFVEPLLELSAEATLARAAAGLDGFVLEADLQGDEGTAGVAGVLSLEARSGERARYHAQAELALAAERLRVASLALTRPEQPGRVEIRGDMTLEADPELALEALLSDLDLKEETGVATGVSGTLRVQGRPSGYRGTFDLANRVAGWQGGTLAGSLEGDLRGISLADLQGSWLRGDLSGAVRLGWAEGFEAAGQLAGRRLDPAVFSADWPGRVNLEVDSAVRIPPGGPLDLRATARLLDSRLRGKALTGDLDARLQGQRLDIGRLELHGDGFDLSAAGPLAERVALAVDIRRLDGLYPAAQGALQAKGWLRWRDAYLSGELEGLARELAGFGVRAEQLKLTLRHQGRGAPIHIDARGRALAYGDYRLERLALGIDGSLASHQGRLELAWDGGNARLKAAGGYRDGAWHGTLAEAGGEDRRFGNWGLERPAQLAAGPQRLWLEGLALASRRGETLAADADLSLQPLRGHARVSAGGLDLARANPWLGQLEAKGRVSADAEVLWPESGPMDMAGRVDLEALLRRGEQQLEISRGRVDLDWDGRGLIAGLRLVLGGGERLSADVASDQPARFGLPEQAEFAVDWDALSLSQLRPWLPGIELDGSSSGDIRGQWQASGELELDGTLGLQGRIQREQLALEISRVRSDFSWGSAGLLVELDAALKDGGQLRARLDSVEPGRLQLPRQGDFRLDWEQLDLARLRPFLPREVTLEGVLAGQAQGRWLPDGSLEVTGRAGIGGGGLEWQENGEGKISAQLRQAELNWDWRGAALTGGLALALSDYGKLEGEFLLPLAARLPVAIDPQGELRARLAGNMNEKGLLAALLPGVVQESRGELLLDLEMSGPWRQPGLTGELSLAKAGAYLPAAGIQLEGVGLRAGFAGETIRIQAFEARSGKGRLTGEGEIRLSEWRLAGYKAQLGGDRFQLINLPELQVQVKPDLQLEGDLRHLKVRGEVTLPEVLVTGKQGRTPVEPSQDVIIVDAAQPTDKPMPLELDVRVRVVLGDSVLIRLAGVDARLAGAVNLAATGPADVTAQGEISVARGSYSTYGVKLNVTRGKVLFAGGPIDRPTLDVLALRTVGEVKAGVRVSGTPRAPVVKLYSEPGMPDTDILGYVVLGHPVGADSGQASMLMVAAGALLSKGESTVLQDRLQRRLGLDVIDIQAGDGDVESSMITLGKYLTPELYISIGRGLVNNANEFRLRYSITRRWELETNVGVESGADLYYKIEFQ
ncbi:hypothetical protein DESUT3_26350 [Desulfuromonas versatilis]|uniref:Translocation and assembly module TamB C-terminal domain-containing protein n=1 Tax=Desulfuromonas versatilis TaxID=2802975 RepID=A0ABM8HU87_9BACT|nr:translocation/assembly module TamB domain-containing protein [Desulfuromonas versatilis]BCR05566.1 hypothetical protein DESUT3_26350 [Desulfuromonas versatilis]